MTDHRPWLASYPEDVPATLEPYPQVSVYSMLERSASRFPDKPAIAFLGKHLSYRELLREVERFSAVLASLGVERGDRVGLLLPNSPQYVIAYYATARLAAVVVGNNPLYTRRELSHQLADAGIKVMVVLDQLYPAFAETHKEMSVPHVVVTRLTDYLPFPLNVLAPLKFHREAAKEGKPWPPVPKNARVKWWGALAKIAGVPPPAAEVDAARDTAGLVYTGGTTGLSKGAMLSHANIVANCMQSAAWFSDLKDGEDAIMCVLPFFHSYGMTVGMNLGIYRAAKLILVPRFELHRVLQQVQKERPTIFPGVPRLYVAINDAAETKKYDLHSIKACFSGAATLPKSVADRFAEITGGRLVEGYGITEASPVTHANPIYGRSKTGFIGLPITDTDCKIVDLEDPDRLVGIGQPGELLIRGPQVMQGYWNRPEDTALTIRNGWLHTGDVATMDEEGYFAIVDRIKDMIIVSGFNVYPAEVESVLARHPAIARVCVVGIPDDTTGEAVKAFIVLREGTKATAEEIVKWSRDPENGLTGYRVPKQVEFRDSLPETLVGKVLRRVLLEEEREKADARAGR
ncbi:MAG: long-chain fatty acid--CoA ligase [Actinomycetota bacterium]|nr:long-chain fatty acid--CoA ligase [Actinomycetota bacterium]